VRVAIGVAAALLAWFVLHVVKQNLEIGDSQPGFVLPVLDSAVAPPFSDEELETVLLRHAFWRDRVSVESLKSFAEQSLKSYPDGIVFVDDRGVVRSLISKEAIRFRQTPLSKYRPEGIGEKFVCYDLQTETKPPAERRALWHLYVSLEVAEFQYSQR
jgi:hypothetical protein